MDKKKSFLYVLVVLVTAIAAAFISSKFMKPAIGSTVTPVLFVISSVFYYLSSIKSRSDGKGSFLFLIGYFATVIAQVISIIVISSFAILKPAQLTFAIALSCAMPITAIGQIISKKKEETPKTQIIYHLLALVMGLVMGFLFAMIIKSNVRVETTYFGTEYTGFTPMAIIAMVLSYFGVIMTFIMVPFIALLSRKSARAFARLEDPGHSKLVAKLKSYDRKTNSFCYLNGVRWYRNSPVITLDLPSRTIWIRGSVNVNLNKANFIKGHITNLDDKGTVESNANERVNEMLAFARKVILKDIKGLSKRYSNYEGEWFVKADISEIHYYGE